MAQSIDSFEGPRLAITGARLKRLVNAAIALLKHVSEKSRAISAPFRSRLGYGLYRLGMKRDEYGKRIPGF